jgi:NAD+ diphosphatase
MSFEIGSNKPVSTREHEWARFCPRCGSAGWTTADGRHFRCPVCGLDYYHNMAAAVCAVIRHDDRIALIVRGRDPGRGLLGLPGGFVDPGETFEAAVIREVFEEIGCATSDPRFLFSAANTYPYLGVTYATADAVFEITVDDAFEITPNDEVLALHWRRLDDIDLADIAFESARYTIERLRRLVPR